MTRLLICTPAEARRLSGLDGRSRWLYLGKDLQKREELGLHLGRDTLLNLEGHLHEVAERLRQPFLDFIADLGKMQTDQLGWWSSSCSWKNTGASDLFLLICYEYLVEQLTREGGESPLLFVVVEDPWLFRQLRDVYKMRSNVQFQGGSSLWSKRAKAFVLGTASRVAWTARLARNYLEQKWFWKRRNQSEPSGPVIALYSYPQARCLNGFDGWVDPHFGGLDSLLEEAGYVLRRFSPPEVGGFGQALGRRSSYFRPLILYTTVLSLLRVVSVSWRPIWPRNPEVGGRPIRWLLLREWWLDRWRSSYPLFRLFSECMSRLIETEQLNMVIYPYENQPWEKMMVLVSRAHRVPTLGYQHGGRCSRFMLPYFYGFGEAEFAPLPDLIVTSGPYSHEMLATGGTPRERLMMGGCFRYQYLRNYNDSESRLPLGSPIRVLVALPIESILAQHLIQALRRAFPDGGRAEGVEFAIKPHPMCPVSEKSLRWPATIVAGTFEEAIRPCSVLIYTGTSTGIEALAMGRRVIRYRPELLLDMDQGGFLTQDDVVDCGDQDLGAKLFSVVQTLGEESQRRRQWGGLLDRVYAPVDDAAWLDVIDRLCRKRACMWDGGDDRLGRER